MSVDQPFPIVRLLLTALVVAAPLQALAAQQSGSISGMIRTGSGSNVSLLEGARMSIVGTPLTANSNRNGEFSFHGLTPGHYTVQASAIGYRTMSASVQVKAQEMAHVIFETEPIAVMLPELEVTQPVRGTPDFLRRRASGRGRYFTRADIERRDPKTISDLLRMVPGMRLECRGMVCRAHSARSPRNCLPAYFMDGLPVDPSAVWTTPPQDLEGMEIYSGPAETPPELEHRASCGAIVLWTRLPPERQPRPKKP